MDMFVSKEINGLTTEAALDIPTHDYFSAEDVSKLKKMADDLLGAMAEASRNFDFDRVKELDHLYDGVLELINEVIESWPEDYFPPVVDDRT